jgi:hypothetical protein
MATIAGVDFERLCFAGYSRRKLFDPAIADTRLTAREKIPKMRSSADDHRRTLVLAVSGKLAHPIK